jgi:glycosyl-4,4'-diaponeurosporenoate acyltransferase
MIWPVLAANLLGWPVLHLAVSRLAIHIPESLVVRDNWLTKPRSWELDGHLYRDWVGIRKWKRLLPDGGPWVGGFSKKRLHERNHRYFEQFILETRRAELAHWCMLGCFPIFFLWNPLWARWVMGIYAVSANLPCILAQRYNRLTLHRVAYSGRFGG